MKLINQINMENKALEKRVRDLEDREEVLTKSLNQVVRSKAYKVWQLFNKVKKKLNLKNINKTKIERTIYLIFNNIFFLKLQLLFDFHSIFKYEIKSIRLTENITTSVKKVDIIIPWYGDKNIFALLPKIFQTAGTLVNKIILVNDCYPDIELNTELEKVVTNDYKEKILYIQNSSNKGFVYSVNVGVRKSKRDVVLLNSDVIPTNDWLKKITEVAISNKKIATVTPLSNNATIFSIPKMNQNYIDTKPEQTSMILDHISPTTNLEVPTAHGFCMFIKREHIPKDRDLFNEKVFKRGYCEENDFSMRMLKKGFINVVATKSYVVHLESQSFGDIKRQQYINENYSKLLRMHPEYHDRVHRFIHENPLQDIQYLFEFFSKHKSWLTEESVLIILHTNPITVVGGVERETIEILQHISKSKTIKKTILYFFDIQENRYTICLIENGSIVKVFGFAHGIENNDILRWILQCFRVKLALVEHLMNHSFEYAKILDGKKVKSILFIHDFFYFCQIPDMVNKDGNFIKFDTPLAELNNYVRELYPETYIDQAQWIQKGRELLTKYFDTVVFNSEYTLETYSSLLNLPKGKNYIVSYPGSSSNI